MTESRDSSGGGEPAEAATGAAVRVRLAERLPELGAFWIRYYPRRWPGPDHPWIHLGLGTLGDAGPEELPGECLELAPDDVVYLPPVRAEHRQWRDRLAREARRGGVRPLAQIHPGEPSPDPCALTVVDPLPLLLRGRLKELSEVAPGSLVAWPLVPGLGEREEVWGEALALLAQAGAVCVQGLSLSLDPSQRRRLADSVARREGHSEELFHALFHRGDGRRDEGLERALARRARRLGLEPFFQRPGPSLPGRTSRNRELAGFLATAGELWLRLGRAPSTGQGLFRAARFAEASVVDLRALAREGNLGVLAWLDDSSREAVLAWGRDGVVPLLDELRSAYLEGDDDGAE